MADAHLAVGSAMIFFYTFLFIRRLYIHCTVTQNFHATGKDLIICLFDTLHIGDL